MQFFTRKSIFPEQFGNGQGAKVLGFNPEDVVTILQIKIPITIFGDQLVQDGFELLHTSVVEDGSLKY
jgi:hypothetical protein